MDGEQTSVEGAREDPVKEKKIKIQTKVFEARPSLLSTDAYSQFWLYVYVVWTIVILNVIVSGKFQSVIVGVLSSVFKNAHTALLFLACGAQVVGLIPFFGIKLWAKHRNSPKNGVTKTWDEIFLVGFVVFLIGFFICFTKLCLAQNYHMLLAMAVLVKFCTTSAKIYAFVREVVPRVLNNTDDQNQKIQLPSLGQYLYFMVAPTMVYRDSYPRTQYTSFRKILEFSGQWFIVTVFMICLCDGIQPALSEYYQSDPRTLWSFVVLFLRCWIPVGACFLFSMVNCLHFYLNLLAELTGFADRQFYLNYWDATTPNEFSVKWNIFGHDWFREYVYNDVLKMSKSREAAACAVLFVSGVFHEYKLNYAFRSFYPIYTILFVIGGILLTISKKIKFSGAVLVCNFVGYFVFLFLLSWLKWKDNTNVIVS